MAPPSTHLPRKLNQTNQLTTKLTEYKDYYV